MSIFFTSGIDISLADEQLMIPGRQQPIPLGDIIRRSVLPCIPLHAGAPIDIEFLARHGAIFMLGKNKKPDGAYDCLAYLQVFFRSHCPLIPDSSIGETSVQAHAITIFPVNPDYGWSLCLALSSFNRRIKTAANFMT